MSVYGGKHNLSFEAYHRVPERWSAQGLIAAHRALGGTFLLALSNDPARLSRRQHWYRLAEGVRAGDPACIALAIDFIEDRFIASYSGFARTRLANALRSAVLTGEQKERLSAHFLDMLERGDRSEEFSAYLRLWPRVVTPRDRERALKIVAMADASCPAFCRRVRAAVCESRG